MNGSTTFWGNLTVTWSYDADKQTLTVSAVLNYGSGTVPMGPVTLTPAHATAHLQGSGGGISVTVDLTADFANKKLTIDAHETDSSGTKVGHSVVDF